MKTYGCVCGTSPEHEGTDIADSECTLDVIRPCKTLTLAAVIIPVVVKIVEGRPFGEPDLLVGYEWRAGGLSCNRGW